MFQSGYQQDFEGKEFISAPTEVSERQKVAL